nr:hypothetical protein [Rhizobium leguminosarum]
MDSTRKRKQCIEHAIQVCIHLKVGLAIAGPQAIARCRHGACVYKDNFPILVVGNSVSEPVPYASGEGILAATARQDIDVVLPSESIIAIAAEKPIVAKVPLQYIVTSLPVENIVAGWGDKNHIIVGRAEYDRIDIPVIENEALDTRDVVCAVNSRDRVFKTVGSALGDRVVYE